MRVNEERLEMGWHTNLPLQLVISFLLFPRLWIQALMHEDHANGCCPCFVSHSHTEQYHCLGFAGKRTICVHCVQKETHGLGHASLVNPFILVHHLHQSSPNPWQVCLFVAGWMTASRSLNRWFSWVNLQWIESHDDPQNWSKNNNKEDSFVSKSLLLNHNWRWLINSPTNSLFALHPRMERELEGQ